jgi:hypothetical protein
MFTVGGNLSLVSAVGGVVLEHVDHVVQRDEGIVDSDHLKFHRYEVLFKFKEIQTSICIH